jgi:hypothetical protein
MANIDMHEVTMSAPDNSTGKVSADRSMYLAAQCEKERSRVGETT